ncbi:MAG: hypothetical protein WDW36_009095 [Sanguina aurantia]
MALQPSFKQLVSAVGLLSSKTRTSSADLLPSGAAASLARVARLTGHPLPALTAAHTDASPADVTLVKARKLAVGVGAFAGMFGGLVGLGGGVLISPFIANACKTLPQRVITGTSLAAVTSTSLTATLVYSSHGLVDPTAALILTCGAVFMSPLGARATRLFDCNALRSLTGYWCYLVSPLLPLKMWLFSNLAPATAAVSGSTATAAAAAAAVATAAGCAAVATADSRTPDQDSAPSSTQSPVYASPAGLATITTAPQLPTLPTSLLVTQTQAGHAVGVADSRDASGSAAGSGSVSSGSTSGSAGAGSNGAAPVLDLAAPTAMSAQEGWRMAEWLKKYGLRDLTAGDASFLGTGALAGFASGLLGVGGGTIMVPLIAAVQLDMTQAQVVATSLAAMIIPSIAGLAQHAALGNVDARMAGGLVLGTLFGGLVGSSLGAQAPPGVLEFAFSVGMLLLGRKTLQNVAKAKAAAAAAAAAASRVL